MFEANAGLGYDEESSGHKEMVVVAVGVLSFVAM